ncbi:MAG: hypothetical protein LBJ08_00335 [Bifidobacteriaceae bacterium]|jgi:hypothetical protein|nr:hypothetical protein [Bifidobacteriaceae bacterium]
MNAVAGTPLTPQRIMELFGEMSAQLEAQGESGHVFVVGGAAMALAYDASRSTGDVDAVFAPSTAVVRAARMVRQCSPGLRADWLNDAAKGFMPGNDRAPRVIYESPTLIVQVASPEYMLAMKLFSSRPERDVGDAVTLYRVLGYTTAEQGLALLEAAYPAHLLVPRHRYFATEVAQLATTPGPRHDPLQVPFTTGKPPDAGPNNGL